ncbi:MAG: PTS transporter subunit EIIC [Erysipelotrichaceae bacterium]|nr:PTS transporter subunit EIIC [Erysipelotrichaceae bacterium]
MKYEKLANELIAAVGGKENIAGLTHCMTRLRFELKDETLADDAAIEGNAEVMSLIKKGGQYQVVIGSYVHDVYLAVLELAGIKEEKKEDAGAEPKKKSNFFGNLLNSIIAVIGPLIPILVATGLGKCILLVVSMLGWADAESSFAYYIFQFVFDAGFTFLPVFVAINAAKHFKCNVMLAALLGCSLVHPSWNAVAQTAPQVIGKFWSLPVYGIKYTSTLIPAMLVVWVMAKVEHKLEEIIPEFAKSLLVPLLTVLIMVPLTFIVLAPSMGILSIYFGSALLWVYNTFGMFGLAAMNIVYPWIVATGTHAPLALAGIQILSTNGYDPFSRTLTLTANAAQGTAAIACALKTKNKSFRSTALSAAFTAFFAGITEPCIYGVSLKLKRPMYAVMIGCGAGGLYAGLVGLKAFAFMTPSVLNFAMWIGGEGMSNLVHAGITALISIVVTFIATWILGFEDPVEE